ncbi:hypothetical protein LINPERPRIM_LOCUS7497 [Linum perenne]
MRGSDVLMWPHLRSRLKLRRNLVHSPRSRQMHWRNFSLRF